MAEDKDVSGAVSNLNTTSATIGVSLPWIKKSHYKEGSESKQIQDKIRGIDTKYGKIINNVASISNVDPNIIKSFIFIESGGKELPNSNQNIVGLMQVGRPTASDIIVREKSRGRLNAQEEAILKKYIGESTWNSLGLNKLKANQNSLGKTWVTYNQLKNPEFNILVGTLALGQLIDEFTENGVPRLDKVITVYNSGRFSSQSKTAIAHKGDTTSLHSKLTSPETKSYIVKLLGENGVLKLALTA